MDAIDALSQIFANINQAATKQLVLSGDKCFRQHREIQSRLEKRVKHAANLRSQDVMERIAQAVMRLRGGQVLDYRELRRACNGCTMVVRVADYVLLNDRDAFGRLLTQVDEQHNAPRRFARLYGQLMRAYFGDADASAAGFERREPLRRYLSERKADALGVAVLPGWADLLRSTPEILSERPGCAYAEALLSGDWDALEVASRALGLTGESWLSGAAIREAAASAARADDREFKGHIPALLEIIKNNRFATLRDEVLAQLIERYHSCAVCDAHPDLRDFAVSIWKNPWLPLNETAWGRVSSQARDMVTGWLKLDLMSEFFALLSEDGHGDRSRFEFWQRYLDQIQDMYFLVGTNTWKSTNPDIRKLCRKLDGRLLRLSGTDDTINAFVMKTKRAIVIEFSKHGNATYIYGHGSMPVDLSDLKRVTISELKNKTLGDRLSHFAGWQSKYEHKLRNNFQLRPDSAHTAISQAQIGSPNSQSANSRNSQHTSSRPNRSRLSWFNDTDFRDLMNSEGLLYQDRREQGGNLRINSENLPVHVIEQLQEWGFSSAKSGFWYRSAD